MNGSNRSLDDIIPPDVPVRNKRTGHIYCHKTHALAHGVLVADMEIIVFNERFYPLAGVDQYPNTHIPKYVGFCAYCGEII